MSNEGPSDVIAATWAAMIVVVGVAVGVLGSVLWVSGQLSGVLTGHGWPPSTVRDVGQVILGVARHPGHPALAWPAKARHALGPTWSFYAVFAVLCVPLGYLTYRLVRLSLNFRRRNEPRRFRLGFASGSEIRRTLSASVVVKKARVVRPSYRGRGKDINPLDVGFYLGRDLRSRQKLYASVEDVFIVLAPPRQGKDVHFCAPFTIDATGACIVTSTRADAFTNTFSARSALGKIHVFDPNGLTNWPQRMRWSPIRGCEVPLVAANRATAFVTATGMSMSGDTAYWVGVAISILRCYLHAAALTGRTMLDVMRWTSQPTNPEPITLLRGAEIQGLAAPGWAGELEACAASEPKLRSAQWATLVQALSCFADPAVLDACSPAADEVFDLREFLSGRNTLYVLGKEKKNGSVAPVITAMMEDIFDEARKIASQSPSSRLDPPLTVELNEVAHIAPMPNLPAYMGDSGGFSIALHVYLQSLSQARARWGDHEAMIMWDNAAVRIIMGGAGNVDDLEDISRLGGEIKEGEASVTYGDLDTVTVNRVRRRVLSPEEIRTLPFGRAVVIARSSRPVEVALTPWWKRPDGKVLAEGKARTEELIVQYGAAAERGRARADLATSPGFPAPYTS